MAEQYELIAKIDYEKFSYIDYFNTEESAGIDKQIVYRNMMRSLWNESIFSCVEGKRLILGTVDTWQGYLNNCTNEGQWERAMIYAMMIYKGKIKKLAGIN